MIKPISAALIFVLNITFLVPSHANENDKKNHESDIETVTVTATRKKETESKNSNIYKLTQEQLETVKPQHIQEVLINVPGVNLQRGNGQEYLPAIRSPVLTGAGSCGAFLTAEDGIPLRSAGFCNVNELFEANTENAERIEVVRGSGTSLYGSNALHGMINVITPEPNNTARRISLEAGSDSYQRLNLSSPIGTQRNLAASLSLTTDGGFREESGFDQQKLNLRYQKSFGNRSINAGLSVTNLNQETAGFIRGLNAFEDDDLVESNPTPEAYRDAQSIRTWLRYENELNNTASFVITPYVRHTDMQFLQHFLPGDPLEENGQTSFGVQTAYYKDINPNFSFITGIDAETTQAFLKQTQDLPTQGPAFLMATIPVGKHYDYEVDANTIATFVYSDWQLSNKWNLVSGLRYENIKYDYDNLMLDGRTREDGTACGFGGCRYSRPADREDSFSNLTSHIQINHEISNGWNTYLKWSKAYRAPQATELYRLQRDQQSADLDSETLTGFDLGTNFTNGNLDAELHIYNQKKDNYIFRDSDFFNVSNGQTKHQGIELFAKYDLSQNFDLALNANFAKHTYDYDQILNDVNINGNDIDTAPRRFGSLTLNWQLTNTLATQLQASHTGSYYLDPENAHEYNGHSLLNLRSHWQVNPSWALSLRINNLLDRNYAERADFTSFTQERYFPGRSRSMFISIEKLWSE